MLVRAIEAQGLVAKIGARRRAAIDSGAGASVWPKTLGEDGRASPNKRRVKSEKVPFRADGLRRGCGMEFLVTDIVTPLTGVSAIADAGNQVVFAKEGPCTRNIQTCEKTSPRREGVHHGCECGYGGSGGCLPEWRLGFRLAGIGSCPCGVDVGIAGARLEEEPGIWWRKENRVAHASQAARGSDDAYG